jgi:hypothetical protein
MAFSAPAALPFGEPLEDLLEAAGLRRQGRLVPALDRGKDCTSLDDLVKFSLGGRGRFGAPVCRVGFPADVAQANKLIDDGADNLLVLPGPCRQVAGADTVGLKEGETCRARDAPADSVARRGSGHRLLT